MERQVSPTVSGAIFAAAVLGAIFWIAFVIVVFVLV